MFDNQTSVCHFVVKGDCCVGVYNQTPVCHFVAKGGGCVGVYNQTPVCHFVAKGDGCVGVYNQSVTSLLSVTAMWVFITRHQSVTSFQTPWLWASALHCNFN